jgi:hypothetical protein
MSLNRAGQRVALRLLGGVEKDGEDVGRHRRVAAWDGPAIKDDLLFAASIPWDHVAFP